MHLDYYLDTHTLSVQVHEHVSSADNSIQDVPVYVTVACFLVSEGADTDVISLEGLTPISFCPDQYKPLLKLFAQPNRYMYAMELTTCLCK